MTPWLGCASIVLIELPRCKKRLRNKSKQSKFKRAAGAASIAGRHVPGGESLLHRRVGLG